MYFTFGSLERLWDGGLETPSLGRRTSTDAILRATSPSPANEVSTASAGSGSI